MAWGVAAGATDEHTRGHLMLCRERPQLATILVQEPPGRTPQRVPEPLWHRDMREVGRPPERGLGGRQVDPQVGTQPVPDPVDQQPANMVHVQVGQHQVGHGGEIDAGRLQPLHRASGPRQV